MVVRGRIVDGMGRQLVEISPDVFFAVDFQRVQRYSAHYDVLFNVLTSTPDSRYKKYTKKKIE